MRIAVAGSSGLIGSALVTALRADGHEVQRIVRRAATAPTEVQWDPAARRIDTAPLVGVDALVNLAGAGVGDRRWSESYKAQIRASRVDATATIAEAAAQLRPAVLVNASAIGWYGDTGNRAVDEGAPAGTGFLADVVRAWEAAADPARTAGVRVVHTRTGLVASSSGGAWQRILPLFRLGLGGRMGSGDQYWSFISMRDTVDAFRFLIQRQDIHGPVNLTAPNPATNRELTAALAAALRRPALLPVPAAALRLVLGEFSQEVLGSARVLPGVLTSAGFPFRDPDAATAMRTLVGR